MDRGEAETFLWLLGERLGSYRAASAAGAADAEWGPELVDEDAFEAAVRSGAL